MTTRTLCSFATLSHGASSGFSEEFTEVYREPTEFAAFWQRHQGIAHPPPAPPQVDFGNDRDMVVAVFRGTKSTGGYGVRITSVEETDSSIVVRFETSDPPPGAMTTCALTQPHHVIVLPCSSKPVTFESSVAKRPEVERTWILKIKKDYDAGTVEKAVESLDEVKDVRLLTCSAMLFVHVHPQRKDDEEIQSFLEGIDGIEFVEADPPIS